MAKYKKQLDDDIRCPLEYGLTLFGGKWKSRIICVLSANERLCYSEIRKEMYNITDVVLAATLKELMETGIIARKSYDEIPPKSRMFFDRKGKISGSDFTEHVSVVGDFYVGMEFTIPSDI